MIGTGNRMPYRCRHSGKRIYSLKFKNVGDIVRRLPDSEVLIEVKENNTVIIECDNSHFELRGMPSDSFPSLPSIEKENMIKVSQKAIRDMIRQTLFAVSMEGTRPILTGSLIECAGNEITFVSIDGFRMALRKTLTTKDFPNSGLSYRKNPQRDRQNLTAG